MKVFYTNPWVPVEWIEAHGLEPRGAWGAAGGQSAAVPEGVCAFAQAMVGLTRAQPEAAVVFTTACDQMRRAADAVLSGRPFGVFLFNLPATWQTSAARRFYHSEMRRLGRFLEALGGHAPTDAELQAVVRKHEERRNRVCEVIRQGAARQGAEALARFFRDGSVTVPETMSRPTHGGVPLALVGGPLLPAQWALFDAIESAGGRVVLNATEPGERCLLPPLPTLTGCELPLAALADHYFDHAVDVFHRPNSRFYTWLGQRLAERAVRGIVLWVHVGCDLWRAEAASLREAFGLPLLVLESHEVRAGGLRDTNRLTAFVESLHTTLQPFASPEAKGCTGHPESIISQSPQ